MNVASENNNTEPINVSNGVKSTVLYTFEEYEDDWGYHIPKGRYRFDCFGEFQYTGDEKFNEDWT